MSCKLHKKYKAIFPPRSDCIDCWKQYALKQKDLVWKLEKCALKYLSRLDDEIDVSKSRKEYKKVLCSDMYNEKILTGRKMEEK